MSFPPLSLPATAPKFYDELAKLYCPHPLQDDLGYERALEVIDWLAPQARAEDQRCFLRVLRELVEDYELQRGEPRRCGVPGPRLKQVWHPAQGQPPLTGH